MAANYSREVSAEVIDESGSPSIVGIFTPQMWRRLFQAFLAISNLAKIL